MTSLPSTGASTTRGEHTETDDFTLYSLTLTAYVGTLSPSDPAQVVSEITYASEDAGTLFKKSISDLVVQETLITIVGATAPESAGASYTMAADGSSETKVVFKVSGIGVRVVDDTDGDGVEDEYSEVTVGGVLKENSTVVFAYSVTLINGLISVSDTSLWYGITLECGESLVSDGCTLTFPKEVATLGTFNITLTAPNIADISTPVSVSLELSPAEGLSRPAFLASSAFDEGELTIIVAGYDSSAAITLSGLPGSQTLTCPAGEDEVEDTGTDETKEFTMECVGHGD